MLDSPVVTPLTDEPAVQKGIGAGQSSWLAPSESWYDDPSRWGVELAQSGPAAWPRVPIGDADPDRDDRLAQADDHEIPVAIGEMRDRDPLQAA